MAKRFTFLSCSNKSNRENLGVKRYNKKVGRAITKQERKRKTLVMTRLKINVLTILGEPIMKSPTNIFFSRK